MVLESHGIYLSYNINAMEKNALNPIDVLKFHDYILELLYSLRMQEASI